MVLGCSTEEDFLDMAKEGLRVAELGLSRCSESGETEHQLVAACRKVLKEAQEAWDELPWESEGEGEGGDEGKAGEKGEDEGKGENDGNVEARKAESGEEVEEKNKENP